MLIGNENINFWSWIYHQGSGGMLIGNDYELLPMSFVPNKFREPTSLPNILLLPNKLFPDGQGSGVQKNVDNYVEN